MSDSLRLHGLQHTRLSFIIFQSLPKLMFVDSVMPSNLCHPLPLLSVFPSISVFSNESALRIRWLKYWSFSFSISPSNEYSGLISFRIDWFCLLVVQGTLKSSPGPQLESNNSLVHNLLYDSTLTSVSVNLRNGKRKGCAGGQCRKGHLGPGALSEGMRVTGLGLLGIRVTKRDWMCEGGKDDQRMRGEVLPKRNSADFIILLFLYSIIFKIRQ